MNHILEKYAKDWLKENLAKCTEAQQLIFKRMYSHKNLELDINSVVDQMDSDKFDNAMLQVERTIQKLEKKSA